MLTAYIVYTLLPLFIMACGYMYDRTRSSKYLILGTVYYTLVVGLRYDVGVDYMSYVQYFLGQMDRESVEIEWLRDSITIMGGGYVTLFIIIAFLHIYYFLYGVRRYKGAITFIILFYFISLEFFLSMNVLRQVTSWLIFLFAIKYIQEKQLVKYLLCIVFAVMFHKSALIFIPFYFIPFEKINIPQKIQYILYGLSIIGGLIVQSFLTENLGAIAAIIGYSTNDYNLALLIETVDFSNSENSLGIAVIASAIVNFIVIYLNPKVSESFNKYGYFIYYWLFFVGMLMSSAVSGTYLDRVNMYFYPFRIIVYGCTVAYLFRVKGKYKWVSQSVVAYILLYHIALYYSGIVNSASKCSPYQFVDII